MRLASALCLSFSMLAACGGAAVHVPPTIAPESLYVDAQTIVQHARLDARERIWPDDETIELRARLARELVAAAELVAALHHLGWLSRALADDYRVFAELGDVRLRGTGDAAGALDAADRCLALAPSIAECLLLRGRALYDLGRHAEAADALRDGLVARATDVDARLLLARILMGDGQYGEARQTLAPLLLAPQPSVATLLLAASLEERDGQSDVARALFERVAALHPDQAVGLGHLRAFLQRAGDSRGVEDVDRRLRTLR